MSKKYKDLVAGYLKEPECHFGTVKVFTDPISNIKFYAGGKFRDLVVYREHLLISLLGTSPSDTISWTCVQSAAELLDKYKLSVIEIDWTDGQALHLGKDFWLDLLSVIRTEKKSVTIYCMGGHGRTGTALSILAALCGASSGDPVQFVRDNYCTKVVETQTQINYIERMTNRKVYCKPKHMFETGFYSSSAIQYGMGFP